MISVKNNLFFIRVFQRLDSRKRQRIILLSRNRVHTVPKSIQVSSEHVHQHSFGDIISVMSSCYFVAIKLYSSSLKSLPSENPAIRTIIGPSNNTYHLIHCPPIKFLIRDYQQWQLLIFLVSFDCLQGIVSISFDSLIYSQHEKFNPILVFFI